ncbi:MAG: DUF2958 domain-containing protein [Acidovorax sp.]|nr:DUF2958 domain-containing protein [Acidovorax sp.]
MCSVARPAPSKRATCCWIAVCARDPDFDPVPAPKLFTPSAGATWLLTEIAFGLRALGLGMPEIGWASLEEPGCLVLTVEAGD